LCLFKAIWEFLFNLLLFFTFILDFSKKSKYPRQNVFPLTDLLFLF
jgi:hypothetical protein